MLLNDIQKQIISFMDLTSLNSSDTNETIIDLCNKLLSLEQLPASICIYPQFVKLAHETLNELHFDNFPIATVANFPSGLGSLEDTIVEIKKASKDGASEIDIVAPYNEFLKNNFDYVFNFIKSCKEEALNSNLLLKVILETGALKTSENILKMSQLAIEAGADFIKTSTGKLEVNATLEASHAMLNIIKLSKQTVGFKAAGGIKTLEDAKSYIDLAASVMGEEYLSSETFRLGASSLLNDVLNSTYK